MTQIALGVALAAIVALLAYRARALTLDGAAAAFVVGAAVFSAGGWPGAAVLLAFFLPSALLSKLSGSGPPRNAWQVFANGGVAAFCALLAPHFGAAFAAGFAGAFAAASADTWGTELGTRFGGRPRSILTFRLVEVGRSGGITLWGSVATAAGALCVAVAAHAVGAAPLWSVLLGGVAGAFLDSVAGASLQALRWCPACACECETPKHDCGTPAQLLRGLGYVGNDAVNFAATLCGAIVAAAIALT